MMRVFARQVTFLLSPFADVKMNHVRSSTVQMRNSGSQGDPAAVARKQEIIRSTELLLDAITAGDFESYS